MAAPLAGATAAAMAALRDRAADPFEIATITAVPAVAMALGSAAVSMAEPSEMLQARLQRFSAGLLVGAVVTEIFPILKEHLLPFAAASGHRRAVSWADALAAVLGFGAALVLMYSLKAMDLGAEDESSDDEEEGAEEGKGPVWLVRGGDEESSFKLRMWLTRLQAHSSAMTRLCDEEGAVDRDAVDEEVHGLDFLVDSARRLCRGAEPMDRRGASKLQAAVAELIQDVEQLRDKDVKSDVQAIDRQLRVASQSLLRVHSAAEKATFRRWAPKPLLKKREETPAVPMGLIIAVVVDAMIDGMLIGLAGAVASTSGKLMAVATTFEMCFLGYSFACSINKAARRCQGIVILAVPPVAMLLSSVLAAVSADYTENSPAFSGMVAFSMVAVLFLVFQELLVEAHEKEGGEAWHISVWLYAGLLLSVQSDLIF